MASMLKILTILLFVVAGSLRGQEDMKSILLRARQAVMDTLTRLPNYVCTQTINRTRYEPILTPRAHSCDEVSTQVNGAGWRRRLVSSDLLRLDVAVSRLTDEMYSWAGQDHFFAGNLFDLVRDGAVSTGSFSSMLASIFGNDAANFFYNGNKSIEGKSLSEFEFRIPLEKSRYSFILRSGSKQEAAMPYDGTLLINPDTADLIRLVVRTNQMPPESRACALTQTLTYDRVSLHGAKFLLPSEARVSLVHTDGTEAENVIKYTSCREFQGESSLTFGSSPEPVPSSSQEPSAGNLHLPPELPFKLVFTESIDTAVAAAGDPIQLRLKTAIRDGASRVLIPAGAPVRGRIVSLKHFYGPAESQTVDGPRTRGPRPSLVIKVRVETVDVGGVSYPLKARFDAGLGGFRNVESILSPRVDIGNLDTADDSEDGAFPFWDPNPNHIVTSGLQSNWLTRGP
jgi:hypothetical protein